MFRTLKWLSSVSLFLACGGPPPDLPELNSSPDQPTCALATGNYAATFKLISRDGTCDSAKTESHDPMDFDSQGRFLSPAEKLIECASVQSGCQLAVRCTTQALVNAKGALDAVLSEDGNSITGTGTLEGSYQDCTRLVYQVEAHRVSVAQ